jgi:aspartate carbamoyltransferase regulatory subunit
MMPRKVQFKMMSLSLPTSAEMNEIDDADVEKRKNLALPSIAQSRQRAPNMTPAMNLRSSPY